MSGVISFSPTEFDVFNHFQFCCRTGNHLGIESSYLNDLLFRPGPKHKQDWVLMAVLKVQQPELYRTQDICRNVAARNETCLTRSGSVLENQPRCPELCDMSHTFHNINNPYMIITIKYCAMYSQTDRNDRYQTVTLKPRSYSEEYLGHLF